MAFNLPLPGIEETTIPSQMGKLNALAKSRIENQYLPLKTQAQALSQIAYANLMGPQFLAKLMNNPDVVSNSPELKNPETARQLYQAGIGTSQGTRNVLSNMLNGQDVQSPLEVLKYIVGGVKNAFGFGESPSNQQSSNALLQNPSNQNPNSGYSYDKNGNNNVATQQQINDTANGNQTYFENAGEAAGIKEEKKELGNLRAKSIDQLGKDYKQDVEAMVPITHLMEISQSPEFANMRNNIPGFQEVQLNTIKNYGTPEQQKIIGDFMTSTKSAVANTVNSFKGRAMAKEFDFGNQLKIGDNDNINVMIGKLESLATFKQAAMQRDRIAMNLMQKKHMNEGDAYAEANKKVDLKGIRDEIKSKLKLPSEKNVSNKEGKILVIEKRTGRKGYIPADRLETYEANGYGKIE